MKRTRRTSWIGTFLILTGLFVLSAIPVHAAGDSAVKDKVKKIVAKVVTSDMTDQQKARVLHDYLIDHAHYDLTLTYHDADGVLLHGTGVCDSYSKAYQLLLQQAGLECRILTGEAVNENGELELHSWNLVKIGSLWYHVDATWDDPVVDGVANTAKSGEENHWYFLTGNKDFRMDHIFDAETEAFLKTHPVSEEPIPPEPVKTDLKAAMPDFSLIDASGKTFTKNSIGNNHKLMMVYGRTFCGNTLAFLGAVKPYVSSLKEHGVTVVAVFVDNPSAAKLKKVEEEYPGVICTKTGKNGDGMWESLEAVSHTDNSVEFPAVFLKNSNNKIKYYSTGYVDEPLAVVMGAQQMADEPYQAEAANTMVKLTSGGGKYTLNLKKKTAVFTGAASKNAKKLKINDTVKSGKTVCKVTKIKKNACKGMKKLRSVKIGKNVSTIGKNAFNGCKKLRTITIKSQKLKASSVGAKAFSGIAKKVVFKVPKSKKTAYKTLLKKKGAPKNSKVS